MIYIYFEYVHIFMLQSQIISIINYYTITIITNMHPKYSALFTSVNLLLGVGPLILPMPFFDAGIVLSIIWMVIICFLSYNSAMFISESMSKLHQIDFNNRTSGLTLTDSLVTSEQQDKTAEEINKVVEEEQQKNLQLDHSDQFQMLFGKKWYIFPSVCISVYLLGTSISKCIMTGKIMSQVFDNLDESNWLRNFNFWIFVFFVSGAAFSFRSIDKTKIMQIIIVGVRVISIVLFLFGAIYLCFKEGVKKLTPPHGGVFNISQFVSLFSNSVFSLMFHHSLPNIVNTLKSTQDVRFVIRNAFLISGAVLMIIPFTGVMAFGLDLGDDDNHLKYYNFDFEDKISIVYWVTSFYVFLNVAAFSVYIIVIRTNVLHMIDQSINAKKLSKSTAAASLIILAIILLLSWTLQNRIQTVLDFTGGVFGIFILFLMPCIQVYRARQLIHKPGYPQNYIRWLPIFIAVLGCVFMVFNLYHIINKLVNPAQSKLQFSL